MTIGQCIALINADLIAKTGVAINAEQIKCLRDPARYDEAIDMIDDMECRIGISPETRGEVADFLTQMELSDMKDYGFLQHGAGTNGPFRTEKVRVKNEFGDRWLCFFEGKWRRVHICVKRTYIVFLGQKITIQIEGV